MHAFTRRAVALVALAGLLSIAACAHDGTDTCLRYALDEGSECNEGGMDCERGTSCSAGVCQRWRVYGELCDPDAGLHCNQPFLCEAGVCAGPRANEGLECDPEMPDACAVGLFCGSRPGRFVCLAPIGPGERCESDDQCAERGLVCIGIGYCEPPPQVAESCSRGGRCAAGLVCVPNSPLGCQPIPVAEGDPCGGDSCPSGMSCVSVRDEGPVCLVELGEGDACESYGAPECAEGLECGERTDTCDRPSEPDIVVVVPEGGACASSIMCAPNTFCDVDREAPRICTWPGC